MSEPPGEPNQPSEPPGEPNQPSEPPGEPNQPSEPSGEPNQPSEPSGEPSESLARRPPDDPGVGGPGDQQRHRLHPLSPLLHGARALVVIIVALSWQTLSRVGIGWFVGMVLVMVVGAVALSVISWFNTGYQVVGRELRIHEGLLWRRTRAIPLERLQAVEVVRPLLAQLTGLAELRLEVVGGGKTEAPLAYMSVTDAVALRERLLRLAGRAPRSGGAWATTASPGGELAATSQLGAGAPPGERPLHAVRNQDLLVSQLLTPQAFLLPFGAAFVLAQFLYEPVWSFIAVASTITAVAGVVLQPVRRVLDDWRFLLSRDDSALRIRHGLVETRAQTVPLDRVQSVGVTWPLLWRIRGWVRLRLDVAGYSPAPEQQDRNRSDRLLPVGSHETARMIVAETLPGVDIAALPLTTPPPRARWVRPLARRVLGAGLTGEVFAARWGLVTRQVAVVPYARIQSVRVVRGPVQRLLRLATVHADTAGGRGAVAHDRDVREAWWLAAELTERARAARAVAEASGRAGRPATGRPDPVVHRPDVSPSGGGAYPGPHGPAA